MKGYLITIPKADYSSIAIGKITPSTPKTTISVVASPLGGGTVSGSGAYDEGTLVTISAVANTDYEFVQWNDGNTNANRQIVVGSTDITYTATFVWIGRVEIQHTSEHNGLMNASAGSAVSYMMEDTFPNQTWLFDIPANAVASIDECAVGETYNFALVNASTDVVIENIKTNNASFTGSYTFAKQAVACKVYAPKNKLGKVFIKTE